MTVSNVSTYYSLQGLLQNMSQSQNSLNNDQIEISSGYKSQTFDGLNGSIQQYVSLNSQVERLTTYQQNNTTYISQLQTTNTALNQIEQIATNIKSLIVSQTSGVNSAATFNEQMQSALTALTAELNTTFQGNYVFGGSKTNALPVGSAIAPTSDGVPNADYYQGSTQDTTTVIGDGQSIDNNVRADNSAFQNIIAGIGQAMYAVNNNSINVATDTATQLGQAENLVSTGIAGVIGLAAGVNSNILTVQQVNSQSQTIQTYYTSLSQNMVDSDTVSLSAKVTQDQAVLQATFETFAKISSLQLSNYLK